MSPAGARDALAAFRQAVETGDLKRLLVLIAPDVVLLTDDGLLTGLHAVRNAENPAHVAQQAARRTRPFVSHRPCGRASGHRSWVRGQRIEPAREGNVMPAGSSPKRERQYEHIKESALRRGESPERAEEIAARTVNKERARAGESRTASRTSVEDPKSASQRGGSRSHTGAKGPTRDQLYAEARRKNVKGRSSMNKEQLARAVGR